MSPGGFYRCGERWLFLACVADEDWRRLAVAMDRPELGTDPRYLTNADRVARDDELQPLVSDWIAGLGDPAVANDLLDRHGVCAEIVYSVGEATRHPHNLARRGVRTVPDDVWGEITIPGVPIRFASVPEEADLRAHELGADTRDVLRGMLGLDDGAIDELYTAGIVRGGGATTSPDDA